MQILPLLTTLSSFTSLLCIVLLSHTSDKKSYQEEVIASTYHKTRGPLDIERESRYVTTAELNRPSLSEEDPLCIEGIKAALSQKQGGLCPREKHLIARRIQERLKPWLHSTTTGDYSSLHAPHPTRSGAFTSPSQLIPSAKNIGHPLTALMTASYKTF